MGAGERPDDPAQRDLAWVGYHPRAAIPYFVLALLGTTWVQVVRWSVGDLSELADGNGALALFVSAWALWPVLVAVFLYRTVTYTYRLTNRSLLADFGMLFGQVPALPLDEVVSVAIGGTWLSRRLGIGRIEVRTKTRTLVLTGIRKPEDFALRIRAAAGKAAEK